MINNILIITKNELSPQLQKLINNLDEKFNLHIIVSRDKYDTIEKYKECQSRYELLIYDHDMQAGISILQNILYFTPQKPILIVSQSPYCSDPNGCENCVANFNKRRLQLPMSNDHVMNIIQTKKFDCPHTNQCQKEISILLRPYFF